MNFNEFINPNLQDCITILTNYCNLQQQDAIYLITSNDDNKLKLHMRSYFNNEIIKPVETKLTSILDDKKPCTERKFQCILFDVYNYTDKVIENCFPNGKRNSYEFILKKIICDDSLDVYKLLSSIIEKRKNIIPANIEAFYKNSTQYIDCPLQKNLHSYGLNLQIDYNIAVEYLHYLESKSNNTSIKLKDEEVNVFKVCICNAMEKLLRAFVVFTQNKSLYNEVTLLDKSDEILTVWPISENLINEFLNNKDKFTDIILGKYNPSTPEELNNIIEDFSDYFIKLCTILANIIKVA